MKTLRIIVALLALSVPATAQVVQLQPGQVLGNSTAARALAQPASQSAMLDRGLTSGTTRGAIAQRNATVWIATITPVLGVPGTSTGTLGFGGITSGTATITPQATAGTPTLTLPNASGTFAVSVSAPLALSATTGNMTITGLAGGVLAGAGPAFTTTPVLGASGTLGTLGFGNATTGTITLQPVAGALGSAVLTMPAATDILAVLAAAQAFTNKTYNGNTWTAGTGTLTIAAGKTLTGNSSLTLAGTDAKTLTVNNSLTLAGTDAKALTLTNGLTVSGNDGTLTFGAASKVLTVNNSIALTGTDSAVYTFPGATATIPRAVLTTTAKAMATTAIASAACSVEQTVTATGTLTTDTVTASFNGDPTAITGFVPLTSGMLAIIVYPKADAVGIKECNNTLSSITPGAHTLNISVLR